MFRRTMLAAMLVGMLSGCATTGNNSPAAIIEQVRQVTVASCGFLPTVATVANIIAAGNPAVAGVTAIAGAICAAVASIPPTQAGKRRTSVPTVSGVVIHGKFVR